MFDYGFIAFDSAALVILLIMLLFTLLQKRAYETERSIFLLLLIMTALSATGSVMAYTFGVWAEGGSAVMTRSRDVAKLVFYMMQGAMAPTYMTYIMAVNGAADARKKTFYSIIMLPFLFLEVLLALNPALHLVYRYTPDGVYERGPLVIVVFLISVFYAFAGLYFFIRYHETVTWKKNIVILFATAVAIAGATIQLVHYELRVELFGLAVSFLLLLLFIEANRNEIDPMTGTYNRYAFLEENRRRLIAGQRYDIISIRINNLDTYSRAMDVDSMSLFLSVFAKKLQNISRNFQVYSCSMGSFAMLSRKENMELVDLAVEQIRQMIREQMHYHDLRLKLHATISAGVVPDHLKTLENISDLVTLEYQKKGEAISVYQGEDLKFVQRETEVEHALQRALQKHTLQIYYQPIWDRTTGKVIAAEALSRLIDDELGFVSPEEFIPIAEKSDLILDLGEYVMESACAMLERNHLLEKGFKYIEINLSEYQLLQDDLVEDFVSCLTRHHLPATAINLEITETAASKDSPVASQTMDDLRKAGFTFSMDDFGTGYSNLTRLFSVDFKNIKIDKSILWDADKSRTSRKFLQSMVQTIHSMQSDVLQEGVETKEQLDYVTDLGTDLVQGFYFSKPVPEDRFLGYVQTYNGQSA